MADVSKQTWEPDAIYLTEVDFEDPDYPLVWASIAEDSGGTEYRRADLPPTLAEALSLPEVAALEEALEALRFEVMCIKRNRAGTLGMALDRAEAALAAMKGGGNG
jgi:hypothetical protein